jgi:hypothetical protein
MIGFIDEAGVPEIPCLSEGKKELDPVFCIGFIFMPMYYWRTLRDTYDTVRQDFGIPLDQELRWRNLVRGTGPASHLRPSGGHPFIEELVKRLDPRLFRAVCVSVFKDDIYKQKGYIREGQDIYNAATLFALQRLQNEVRRSKPT